MEQIQQLERWAQQLVDVPTNAVGDLRVAKRLIEHGIETMNELKRLRVALREAEAALADIGDADREPGDDLAWCERRAAEALPNVRAALAT